MEWWLAMAADADRANISLQLRPGPRGRWWCDLDMDGLLVFGQAETPIDAIRRCHAQWQREVAA